MSEPIILATNNTAKINDFAHSLEEYHLNLITMKGYGLDLDIEETSTTYYENASIKARKIHEITGKTVIAEDSGFEFDYLNGEPNIYSKRYLFSSPFKDKINIILERMEDATKQEQRGMAFKGSIVCITSNKTLIHRNFSLCALCAYEPRGTSSIDYYKIMYLPNYAKTVAELLPSQWYKINPRIEAIKQVYQSLREV